MALQGETVDVPLGALNQQAPTTSGPIGRLKSLVNGVVKKIQRGPQAPATLRVEKRDGFTALPTAVRDPATGAVSSKSLTSPTLLGTYGAQLVAIFLAAPFVLSEAAGCWESPTYNAPTQVLRSLPVASSNDGVVVSVDSARIGTRTMDAWATQPGAVHYWYQIIDDDGTVIRSPNITFTAGTGKGLKCVADGTQFWLIVGDGTTGNITAQAFDTNGNSHGLTTIATTPGTFDVTQNTAAANSIIVLHGDGAGGFKMTRSVWNGSSYTNTVVLTIGALNSQNRVAFLTNNSGDHNYWFVTVDGAGPFVTSRTVVADGAFTVFAGPSTVASTATAPVEATGWVDNSANCTIALSFLDTTPTPQLNNTLIYTMTSGGVPTQVRTQKSLTLASRAFRLQSGGDYYAVGYYHSNPAGATQVAQSTFYLIDLGTNYQVAGRFEYGTAYQDWLTTAVNIYYMALSSPQTDPSGGIHIALAYRASSTIAVTTTGDTFTPTRTLVDVVGIKDYQFGPDNGQPVEHSGALFLPGPETVNYTGATFAEDGLGLIPEVTSIGAGAGASLTGTYEYVVVDEWTDNNGQRVRSPAGVPISRTVAAGSNLLTGLQNHVTRKTNVIRSVYRTVIQGGVQSTLHYKVSGSLQGGTYLGSVVVNDDTADTWTFNDNMIDSVAANNEVLYTDKGLLDHFPAPPYSVGLAAFDRIFLAGYDNAVWFSGPKSEGDSFWFHPTFRIPLPTREKVRAIRQLDNLIVVLCERNAMFAIPAGPFPDATGTDVAIPSPVPLPFSNGCTGFAETISDGIVYSSVQGGIWKITRGMDNVYIGAPVEDLLTAGGPITGVATDDKQRLAFALTDGSMVVYDQVTGVWSSWRAVANAALLTEHKGRFAFISPGQPVFRQTIGQYYDDVFGLHSAYSTTTQLAYLHLGGIRRYKRLWQVQMIGQNMGDHDLTVTVALDDDPTYATKATASFTPGISTPYIYELPANELTELCSSISYTFTDFFPRGPTAGYALEAMAFYVGVESRLGGVPATQQIKTA